MKHASKTPGKITLKRKSKVERMKCITEKRKRERPLYYSIYQHFFKSVDM